MHVNLIFGFLGSGKTTLVRRILQDRASDQRMAVIVNEFGDVGVDGAILEGRDVDMVELTSGCLCCTLKGSLLNAVEELREKAGVERTVIEATGLAAPEEMIETFADPSFAAKIDMGPFVTVVDAAKYPILREMLGEFYVSQIAHADLLLVNKVDLVSAERLEALRAELVETNPEAAMLFTEQCDADLDLVLDAAGDLGTRAGKPTGHGHHHAHFDSFVLEAGAEVSRAAVEAFFSDLPADVLRAKGFMRIDGTAHLVQFAAGQLEFEAVTGREDFKMVFIGRELDRAAIEADFPAAVGEHA